MLVRIGNNRIEVKEPSFVKLIQAFVVIRNGDKNTKESILKLCWERTSEFDGLILTERAEACIPNDTQNIVIKYDGNLFSAFCTRNGGRPYTEEKVIIKKRRTTSTPAFINNDSCI